MKKSVKPLLTVLLLFSFLSGYGQLEAFNWYFGEFAGLQFTTPVTPTQGQLNTLEGCSSISDAGGNLLFYTDGITIYNAQHQVMPGGNNLLGNPSSSQSGLIVPHPGNPGLYYVFTISDEGNYDGLRYTLVDMSLNGGWGGVILSEKNVLLIDYVQEKLTAIKNPVTNEVWVLTLGTPPSGALTIPVSTLYYGDENTIYAIKISSSGISPNVTATTFNSVSGYISNGYLKISPDGTKIAFANYYENHLYLCDFNIQTGEAANMRSLNIPPSFAPYGIEFSPDNRYLYVHGTMDYGSVYHSEVNLLQYDLNNPALNYVSLLPSNSWGYRSGMQLAIDGKIYITESYDYNTGDIHLSTIENPNAAGNAAQVMRYSVSLAPGTESHQGLPQFIQSYFISTLSAANTCLNDTTRFTLRSSSPIDYVQWDFGDGTTDTSNPLPSNPYISQTEHLYSQTGLYNVLATVYDTTGNAHTDSLEVEIYPLPEIDMPDYYTLCETDYAYVEAPAGFTSYSWSTGATTRGIMISEPGYYTVEVTNENGCSASKQITVVPCIKVYTFFSPNDDGINDYWTVEGIEFYENTVEIYNRWGNLVYLKENYQNDWDGRANAGTVYAKGEKLPPGTYFYIIHVPDEEVKKGYLYLNY